MTKYFAWMGRGLRPGSAGAFAFALACIELATFARVSLEPVTSASAMPYITYFPAILFATFFGGFWAGWTSLIASIGLTWWWFLTPYYAFKIPSPAETVTLAIFTATASVIVGGCEHYRRMLRRLEEEEHHRELLVSELEHRMKNKLATVYAILGRELRGHPEIWERVDGRVKTLTATDEFIARSNGRGARFKDILNLELAPYDASRVTLNSDDVFLPAKAATILALMFHELATNAAKYGALSVPSGHVAVDWKVCGERMDIAWAESGGPGVSSPAHRGFGTSLLERGLDAYRGRTMMRFDPAGFACKLSFVLPDHDSQDIPQALYRPRLRYRSALT